MPTQNPWARAPNVGLWLLETHIQDPSSQNNHPDKLLIAHIIYASRNSTPNISITKVGAQTNMIGHDEADKLAKLGTLELCILLTTF